LFQVSSVGATRNPKLETVLLHFFVRGVLAAAATELFELQPFRGRLPVLGGRIIPVFAITALQRHNFSGHKNNS
jgi:hypothetical protein